MSLRVLRRPPRIKVLEAIGSIGDGRIEVLSDTEARVTSSRGDKVYRVIVIPDGNDGHTYRVYSNDNGTIYRGYIGYPIIAFLMVKGIIPIDREVMNAVTGVPWKDLNERYKRYAIVEDIIMRRAENMGVKREIISEYIEIVFKKLSLMKFLFDETLAK